MKIKEMNFGNSYQEFSILYVKNEKQRSKITPNIQVCTARQTEAMVYGKSEFSLHNVALETPARGSSRDVRETGEYVKTQRKQQNWSLTRKEEFEATV